jgi:imidazolonepropionase-like amidohydrolase
MKKLKFSAALLSALLFVSAFAVGKRQDETGVAAEATVITGATVIDGTGAEPTRADVLIRGDRVAAVGERITIPPGARVIRADGQTLLPGLFDLHTHLPYATAAGVSGDWPKNLKAYLYCGVTSVVDFGTYAETFEPMRKLIASGEVSAPRLTLAARMTTPGGHGAEGGRGDFFTLEVLTPREARAAVRRVLPYKPDAIKVFTDGWRYGAAPDMTSMREDTLAALVDEAHKNGLPVMTHTVTLDKAKVAARAGVDVLVHGIGDADVDEELIGLMKQKGTVYVSTLAVYEPRGRNILSPLLETVLDPLARAAVKPPLTPPGDQSTRDGVVYNGGSPRARRWQFLTRNVKALGGVGVRLGAGTDAGVTGAHHGWATLRELQLLVAAGLTPLEAITAATGESAKAIKVDAERGTIAPGKLADLVLVDGSPHRDIAELERVSGVFLGGREVNREQLARDIASPAVTRLAPVKVDAVVDDFERADGRSRLGTLWVNSTDPGHDHSQMLFGRAARENSANRALVVMARMSETERPFARVSVPLSRGAVVPADVRRFRGVEFEARGDGEYQLIVPTANVRDSNYHQAAFKADARWRAVRVDFASLKRAGEGGTRAAWRGDDVLMLTFEVARGPGELGRLELDNIRFY